MLNETRGKHTSAFSNSNIGILRVLTTLVAAAIVATIFPLRAMAYDVPEWFALDLGAYDSTSVKPKENDTSMFVYLSQIDPLVSEIQGQCYDPDYGFYVNETINSPVYIYPVHVGYWRLRTMIYEDYGYTSARLGVAQVLGYGRVGGMWCPDSPDWAYAYPSIN